MFTSGRVLVIQFTIIFLATLVSLVAVELFLRAFPSVISVSILAQMEPGIRARIAGQIGLPTVESSIQIPTEMRSDKGPVFLLPGPDSLTITRADKADLALGAIELVQVDKNGLCNDPQKANLAKADILVSGDSFTFCTAVKPEETAASRLQELSHATVYNLGVRGVGPDEYLEMLKLYAPIYKPKIAVMNIYEGNDLRGTADNIKFHEGRQKDLPKRHKLLKEEKPRRIQSYAWELIRGGAKLAKHKYKSATGKVGFNFRYTATLNGRPFKMNINNQDQDEVRYAIMLQQKKIDLNVFNPTMTRFANWARENSIVPVVIYIPSMYSAYQPTVRFQDEEVGRAVQAFSAAQRAWFAENARALNYKFADLTPQFQAAGSAGRLTHFPSNVHLTPTGHAIVAQGTLDLIRKDVAH